MKLTRRGEAVIYIICCAALVLAGHTAHSIGVPLDVMFLLTLLGAALAFVVLEVTR